MSESFQKTEKQAEAVRLIGSNLHTLLYGGSRSGKTFLLIRCLVIRALKRRSRHLICRHCFKHVKQSVWHDTFPKVMELCFPGVGVKTDKQSWFYTLPNGSEIWLGGIDDKERTERILGNEYSTILANEVSQMGYDSVSTLQTRLAENSGLTLRFLYDCNPPSKKHWTYLMFMEGRDPIDGTPIDMSQVGAMRMNPTDNAMNLPPGYIENILEKLPRRKRQRFLEGKFLVDVEGALWDNEMVDRANARAAGNPVETAIGVDPSGSSGPQSDLCGIVAASRDEFGDGIVHADYSMRASPQRWGEAVVNAYHMHDANYVVAEQNYGGDMVKTIIHNIDPSIKVYTVHAKKGKYARAEPVSQLYEQNRVTHEGELHELETEMMEYVPIVSDKSPDRLDAAVFALTRLMIRETVEPKIRVV